MFCRVSETNGGVVFRLTLKPALYWILNPGNRFIVRGIQYLSIKSIVL